MSMQMDACLKKEQIGTLLFGWGHWKGGLGGGSLRDVHPKKCTCRPKKEISCRQAIKKPLPTLNKENELIIVLERVRIVLQLGRVTISYPKRETSYILQGDTSSSWQDKPSVITGKKIIWLAPSHVVLLHLTSARLQVFLNARCCREVLVKLGQ